MTSAGTSAAAAVVFREYAYIGYVNTTTGSVGALCGVNECVVAGFTAMADASGNVALLSRLAEEDSVHGGIREGVVVRPVVERVSMAVRCVLKVVSERYLLRKGGTEHH